MIFDEADAIFGTKKAAEQHKDLRALLNAGYQRNRPALRCVNQIPSEFPTFAMAALAGIGNCFPDTVTDLLSPSRCAAGPRTLRGAVEQCQGKKVVGFCDSFSRL